MRRSSPSAEVIDAAAVPLDEAELNGLITAARNESYRPTEAMRLAPVEDFRPKSLLELARQRRDTDAAARLVETEDRIEDAVIDAVVVDAAEPAVMAPAAAVSAQGTEVSAPTAVDAVGNGPAAASVRPDPARPLDGERGQEQAAPPAKAAQLEAARPVDPAVLEQVRSEAYAAGRADAEADALAGLSDATRAFEAAAKALLHPAEDALAALRAEITDAVLQIASERAGIEIDAMPAAFVERIEALADRIHSRATQPVLRINPADLSAIETHIAGSDALSMMRIVASEDLQRGDVDLAVEGLRLSDRIMGQPASRKGRRPAAKPASDNA